MAKVTATDEQIERVATAAAAAAAGIVRTWALKRALQRWVDPKTGWKDAYVLSIVVQAVGAWWNQGVRNDNTVAEKLAVEPNSNQTDV